MGNIFSSAHPPLLSLLPEDVLIRILVRLPAFSLLRFKSVCKSWRALIETSFFIDLHTVTTFNSSSSSSSSKFDTFLVQSIESSTDEWERTVFMLSRSGGVGDDGDDEEVVFKMDKLWFPSCYKVLPLGITSITMVGSCNGLVCLHDLELRDVSLWNPATRQFRILPKSITFEQWTEDTPHDFIMFGFDVETKDYKVVKVTCFGGGEYYWRKRGMEMEYKCRVQVYNLSTNSWRHLEGIDYLPAKPDNYFVVNQGIYRNGSYFFLGRSFHSCRRVKDAPNNNFRMFSFDFTTEIFTPMQQQFPEQNRECFVLCYLGDKMALLTLKRSSSTGHLPYYLDDYDLWVLNNEEEEESWTKLQSFQIKNDSRFTHPKNMYSNGDFALIQKTVPNDGTFLQLFNLGTKKAKKDFAFDGYRISKATIYEPSLVSIIGGNGNGGAAATTTADRLVSGAM